MRLLRAGQRSILGVGLLSLIMSILVHKEYIDLGVPGSQTSGILTGSELEAIRAEALLYPSYHPPKRSLHNFTYMKREYISQIPLPYETIVDDPWASPYEIRWPGYHLPQWAQKVGAGTSWKEVPQDKHICYCSVGKAAGSSVSGLLGFQLHRPDVYFIPQGVLAHYTTHIFHGTVNNCADHTPYYLFTMRHPLRRLQSAFRYDRDTYGGGDNEDDDKSNAVIYKTCKFKTLNILAVHGLSADGKSSQECKQLAYDLVRGSGYDYSYHMFSNYQYYLNVSFAHHDGRDHADESSSKLLVIRTEHMEDDWNSAERVIRMDDKDDNDKYKQNAPIELNIPHLNVKEDTVYQDQLLSTKAQVLLCEALCREIQTYKDILKRAVNLNRHDYLQSMKELQDSCPLQVHSKNYCPEDDLDAYYSTRPKREKKG